MKPNAFRIVIVGAGPMGVYAMERLAAHAFSKPLPVELRISVFERCGRFGAGEVHSDVQPFTSVMNRIVGQIALGADESNEDASVLLPRALRVDFPNWLSSHPDEDSHAYRLEARDVPQRRVHGLALRTAFEHYVRLLTEAGARVDRYASAVVDVSAESAGYSVHAEDGTVVMADHVLFVTGHSRNLPQAGSFEARPHQAGRYIGSPYPLERTLDTIRADSTVAIRGLGLTAIDTMLYLTEGRGGRFVPAGYERSGREPRQLVGFSPTGLCTTARPDNYKSELPGTEHTPCFFSIDAIRALRRSCGVRRSLSGAREQRQLDFTQHLFPLIVLEMGLVYYDTLLGKDFGQYLKAAVQPRYRTFVEGAARELQDPIEFLLEPMQRCFDEAAEDIEHRSGERRWNVLQAFTHVLFGGPLPDREAREASWCIEQLHTRDSPWGHSLHIRDHRFDWRAIFDPMGKVGPTTAAQWRRHVLEFMRRDLANAAQGNLCNPVKAACDGVWRDLRGVLCEALDFGGLRADSHVEYRRTYHRYYCRLSNGASRGSMKKVLALIEDGILDISCGPGTEVTSAVDGFVLRGPRTGARLTADVLVEARIDEFDAARDVGALYPNLLRRGLVRRFCNPGGDAGADFFPGGLDLCERFHPVRADGRCDAGLTFLGAPAEGIRSFQTSAARPGSNSYILNVVARWAEEVLTFHQS